MISSATTISVTEPKGKASVPIFMPRNFIKWEELIKGFLMRHSMAHLVLKVDCPPSPTVNEVRKTLIRKNGKLTETKRTRLLFENSRKSQRLYEKRNLIAYSYILESVSDPSNEIGYRVVSDYTKDQEEVNQPVTAKGALQRLRDRFHVINQRVLQAELANFNSMVLVSNEKAESFVNRLLDSKATLANLGRRLDDNTDLLGRLIAGLKASEKYAAVGHLMGLTTDLTWRKAVDQIVAGDYESVSPQKADEEAKSPENATTEKANMAADGKGHDRRDNRGKHNHDRRNGDKWCTYHRTSSHDDKECKSQHRDHNRNRSKVICYFCDKEGHTVERCEEKRRYLERKKRRRAEVDDDGFRSQRKREAHKPDSDDSSFGG